MRLAYLLPLLVLAGCPESSAPSATPPVDPAAQRAAQVEFETRLAEGGDALEVEAPPADAGEVAQRLPELRYYAFDG